MSRDGNVKNGRRKLPIGIQDFESLRRDGYLYVDKTSYVFSLVHEGKPYFLSRPRRFGKTLNMSMLECFFSVKYKDRADLFEGLSIWKDEKYRNIQGTYPVINMTFSSFNIAAP